MLFKLGQVVVENVIKGKNRWSVATVNYTYNGEARTQKMMSFANPEVFKQVQELPEGTEIDVTVTKNDQGYNQWAKLVVMDKNAPAQAPAAPTGGKVLGSQYETRDERNARQLMIVKQSSLSNALKYYELSKPEFVSMEDILDTAQRFTEWVYDLDASFAEDAEVPGN